jgi:glycerol kinase
VTILAIDAGTTGITALLVSAEGKIVARGYREFEQHYPQPGWVEHEPEQIWQATRAAVADALAAGRAIGASEPTCIGITNQRETVVLWDRQTLSSPTNAIVWQDRRTAGLLDESKFLDSADWVRATTGLPLDPYFSSSKLLWIKRNLPEIWRGVEAGVTAVGTVESYLVARITGGREHITDASNASRTQLYNLETGDWDDRLLDLFEVPRVALPRIVSNYGNFATSLGLNFFDLEIPITGLAGDQQAALFGQGAVNATDAKSTYGTGAFLLLNTGDKIAHSEWGLLSTVAWQHPSGARTYALEGSVFVAGAAVQWLRDGLGIIESSSDVEALAASVPDSGGVSFIPSLTGLGAPFWNPDARGLLHGITRGTTKAHIARATLEGIAYQVSFVVEAMAKDAGIEISRLRVDGGAAANNLLMQIQANQLQATIERPAILESTGFGAALFAGLGAGIWSSLDEVSALNEVQSRFTPGAPDEAAAERWLAALATLRAK